MKNEKMKYGLICAICAAVLGVYSVYTSANKGTDIIMPAWQIVEDMASWYVLLAGICAETAVIKWFLKESWLKSAAIALVINLISTVLGIVTLSLVGLVVELLFFAVDVGTFHVSHWIVNFIFIVLFNACFEGLIAKIGFKLKFKKTFSGLCLANAASFLICCVCNLFWISEMFF